MTLAQYTGVIRAVIMFVGGIFVTRGWLTSDQLSQVASLALEVVGAILSLVTIIWSIYSNHERQLGSQLRLSKSPLARQAGLDK
jgi:fumarate reductase subunit D